jgi:hypothetical protein
MDQDAVEEIKRHFGVVAEDLRSDIRAVAEGQNLLREQLSSRIDGLEREMRSEFEEVKAMSSSPTPSWTAGSARWNPT